MAVTYKVGSVAKDLGLTNKQLLAWLEEKGMDISKKHNTVLEESWVNYFIEILSKQNMAENLESFLEKKTPSKPSTTLEKSTKTTVSQKKEEGKEGNSPMAQPTQQPKVQAGKVEKPLEKSKGSSTEEEVNKVPQAKIVKPIKKAIPAKRNDKEMTVVKLSTIGEGNSMNVEEKKVRHIDTKTTAVNLEKYNERYEKIAPSTSMSGDNVQKKQKLNQRSAQRGRMKKTTKPRISETEKLQRIAEMNKKKKQLRLELPEELSVAQLANMLKVTVGEVIKKLMGIGIMAAANQNIDFDTASLVALEFGAKVTKAVVITMEERVLEIDEDTDDNLQRRHPIVVVMGHVDHGKTSLLDTIRKKNVTEGEAGGITQHIGAYRVQSKGDYITFLDTPGHEAFTSMRARGASATDIAILVVAADDGIMPQTVEAINHAKAAGVEIIVAINKMDKPGANPEKIKQELTEYELVAEEWGGNTICIPISAKTGENIDQLLEMIQLTADVMELKANPERLAKGIVVEAKLDIGKGPVATILVQNGTLKTGDVIIAGSSIGRVRLMTDENGRVLEIAGPSTPVEITGLSSTPEAGDVLNAVKDEKLAKTLVEDRKYKAKEEIFKAFEKVTLDNLFTQIEQGDIKELPLIIKGDVQGSVEAIKQSLLKLSNEEVKVKVIHSGVGVITESDVMLAGASGAIIIGFNVRPHPMAQTAAELQEVEIRMYRIIYDAIEEVKDAMKGMLDPKIREVELGKAEVRMVYKLSTVGAIAGCYVTEGKIVRNSKIRVVRDGVVLAEDDMKSLKRFKDDVKEAAKSFECGISLEKFHDIKEGDILESFILEEYRD